MESGREGETPSQVRIKHKFHRLRGLPQPVPFVGLLLRLVLRRVNLACELAACLELVEHVQLDRHLCDLLFL